MKVKIGKLPRGIYLRFLPLFLLIYLMQIYPVPADILLQVKTCFQNSVPVLRTITALMTRC